MKQPRGYFSIGVYHPKFQSNIGSLWRTAYQLGASEIFTIGSYKERNKSDTLNTWKHIPLRIYSDINDFINVFPKDCVLIGIEEGGQPLKSFTHPERAYYLLGNESQGLPEEILDQCQTIVSLSGVRTTSYNVAIAGSIVLYHRVFLKN